MNIFIRRSHDP